MSNRGYDGSALVVYAQVGQAKANHRVENDTGFLRPKSFALPSKVVYLGDVATHALAYLENPETPHFSEPPQFNEQKWKFETQSGGLRLTISSNIILGLWIIQLRIPQSNYSQRFAAIVCTIAVRPFCISWASPVGVFSHLGCTEVSHQRRRWRFP